MQMHLYAADALCSHIPLSSGICSLIVPSIYAVEYDTSKNTEATSKCLYALHIVTWWLFSRDQHPLSRNGYESSARSVRMPLGGVI